MTPQYALVPVEIGDNGETILDTDQLVMLGSDLAGVDAILAGDVDGDDVGDVESIEGQRRRRRSSTSSTSSQGRRRTVIHHKKKGRKSQSGIFGLDSISVLAAGTGQLQELIQEPVYFQRLVFDGEPAYFKVTDVKIGSKSQMSGTAPFPAGAFRPDATNAGFSINKIGRVGQYVTVSVTNIDAANARALSGMIKTLEVTGRAH